MTSVTELRGGRSTRCSIRIQDARASSIEEAPADAIRVAERRGPDAAEPWDDCRATEEAERGEPPEAWREREEEERSGKLPSAARSSASGYTRDPLSREKKRALLGGLVAHVETEIATMRKAAYDAAEAATHAEAKPENDKDTRALEASYLAAGQAARVADLENALKLLVGVELKDIGKTTPICATAVITLEDDDGVHSMFFMSPHGGGVRLDLEGASVQVVTPQSPLGKALLGRLHGDVIELRGKSGLREMTIVDVW